jgi:hypothetical protein
MSVTLKRRTKTKKHAVTREEVYKLAWGCIKECRPEPAAVAVICFEWLQRPENVVAGLLAWPDYRSNKWPHAVRIEHHKNKTLVWHPLEEIVDGELIKFYAEAEDILSHLPKIGVPMIMRKVEKGEAKGTAKVWSYPGMEKLVQQLRKKIDGVSELFTLDACRHGGMTELEEAELTEGQGRALSGHKTAQAYRGYAKETMQRALAATRKRHAHLIAQKQVEEQSSKEFPNGGRNQFPNTSGKPIENKRILRNVQRVECWLGREDSNLRMAESKSAALPLGYAPSGGGAAAAARADHSGGMSPDQRPVPARRPPSG